MAHAGDHFLKSQYSEALSDTYTYLINKGSIDPKYFESRELADLAPEFGRIQKESYGVEKLDTLRKIFANLARDAGRSSHKKYLLGIAIGMTEPEIKVLLADAELVDSLANQDQRVINSFRNSHRWREKVASTSGLKHEALVEAAETGLVNKGLMSGWVYTDRSGNNFTANNGRLTSMGIELLDLMKLDDDPISVNG